MRYSQQIKQRDNDSTPFKSTPFVKKNGGSNILKIILDLEIWDFLILNIRLFEQWSHEKWSLHYLGLMVISSLNNPSSLDQGRSHLNCTHWSVARVMMNLWKCHCWSDDNWELMTSPTCLIFLVVYLMLLIKRILGSFSCFCIHNYEISLLRI